MVIQMKKFAKGALALLLAAALCFSLAGCYNEDLTWSAKKNDTELPIGAYIYYLSVSYNEAAAKIGTDEKVLKSEIEGKPAEEWIRDRAQAYVNQYFWMNDEMARLGIELGEEDYASALQNTENYWRFYGPALEDYGIAKSSFDVAYSQYNAAYLKVLTALYSEGGEREVSDDEIAKHYTESYYDYEYFTARLTKKDDEDKTVDMTDEEKNEVKKTFEAYRKKINAGEMTLAEAADDYAEQNEIDPTYVTAINDMDGMKSAYLPTDFIDTLDMMKEDSITVFEASGSMVILRRLPIADSVKQATDNADNRIALIAELRGEEFGAYVRESAQGVEGVGMNEKAIARYKPSMFTDVNENGTSSVPEEESSEEESSSEE